MQHRRVVAVPIAKRVVAGGEAAHLERLTLEAFQSGLSWLIILRKRPAFREAFSGFDLETVAAYDLPATSACWNLDFHVGEAAWFLFASDGAADYLLTVISIVIPRTFDSSISRSLVSTRTPVSTPSPNSARIARATASDVSTALLS